MLPSPPQFDVILRGYDRTQVEEYLVRVQRALDESERRAAEAERRVGALEAEVASASRTEPPEPDFSILGQRITRMLDLAKEEAADLVRRGDEHGRRLVEESEGKAEAIREEAIAEANSLRAEVAGAREEAESIRSNARQEAEELLQRARWHAEDQAEGIVAKAEAEARRVLAEVEQVQRAREEEWANRRAEHEAAIKALEERHARIVADLSRLRATLEAAPGLVGAALAEEAPAGRPPADQVPNDRSSFGGGAGHQVATRDTPQASRGTP